MPISHLQPRLQEAIRIRTGYRGPARADGYRPPVASETFILTAGQPDLLAACYELYGGGGVERWEEGPPGHQWRLVTDKTSLDVLLPPAPNIWSQWMERWSGGGCLRRCDGMRDSVNEAVCDCPPDWQERRQKAARGEACKETTRLTVLLRHLPDLVGARLESHSYHTAVEMLSTTPFFAAQAYERGIFIPGVLAIEERQGQRVPGKPTPRFKVVSFRAELGATLDLAALGAAEATRALPPASALEQAAGQEVWPVRDVDQPAHPSIDLAALARERGYSQPEMLRLAREVAADLDMPLPCSVAELGTHPVLARLVAKMEDRTAGNPF